LVNIFIFIFETGNGKTQKRLLSRNPQRSPHLSVWESVYPLAWIPCVTTGKALRFMNTNHFATLTACPSFVFFPYELANA
jgi:hypothetical protein